MKKKIGVKESVVDDIRKISEMLTDDPDVFTEEGMPMGGSMGGMKGGDVPPPPPMGGGEGMPADDMAPEGEMAPEAQWVVMMTGEENKVVGPFSSREEALAELQKCHGGEGMPDESGTVTDESGTMAVVELKAPGQGMPGEEEVGGEDLPPMGDEMGGDELGGDEMGSPAAAAGGGPPPAEEMGGY